MTKRSLLFFAALCACQAAPVPRIIFRAAPRAVPAAPRWTPEGMLRELLGPLMPQYVASAFTHAGSGTCATSFGNGFALCQQKEVANGGSGATVTATLGSTMTAGHQALVFGFTCADSGCSTTSTSGITLTVADTNSDSHTQVTGGPFLVDVNHVQLTAWCFSSVTANSAFTVTATGGTPYYMTAAVSEWSGLTCTYDGTPAASFSASGVTSASASCGTTSNAVDLIVGFIELGGGSVTAGSGFTQVGQDVTGIQSQGMSVSATGAQSSAWTFSSTTYQAECMAVH